MKKRESNKSCPYCTGKGYFQLMVGGTETCEYCSGRGKVRN
ncbi:YuiA family protein [Alteribacillus sp. JSM 102045]